MLEEALKTVWVFIMSISNLRWKKKKEYRHNQNFGRNNPEKVALGQ